MGQLLVFEFRGVNLSCRIADMEVVELDALKHMTEEGGHHTGTGASQANRGVLMRQSSIQFTKSSESTIRLKGAKRS